mmetsp:Transcript_58947/g.169269  ORF Transcript_58947/g.169269 Transcript_58947/m.169269 type:complete len:232 (-) Transcript_58947:82-777(-)
MHFAHPTTVHADTVAIEHAHALLVGHLFHGLRSFGLRPGPGEKGVAVVSNFLLLLLLLLRLLFPSAAFKVARRRALHLHAQAPCIHRRFATRADSAVASYGFAAVVAIANLVDLLVWARARATEGAHVVHTLVHIVQPAQQPLLIAAENAGRSGPLTAECATPANTEACCQGQGRHEGAPLQFVALPHGHTFGAPAHIGPSIVAHQMCVLIRRRLISAPWDTSLEIPRSRI